MSFSEFASRIRSLGRNLNPEALLGTRAVIEPLIPADLYDGVEVTRDLSYGTAEKHRLDVFTAQGQEGLKPVLLFVHGGGFIQGDKGGADSPFYSSIGVWAVRNGFAGVNMTYRLAPANQFPSGIEDLRAVVEFIQQNGAEHGLDANNIFLMGQSAGGAHSAGYLANPEVYGNAPHGLKGAIMLSGVYDFVTMPTTEKESAYLGDDASTYAAKSSLTGLLDVDIPLLITMAEYDPPPFQAQCLQLLNAWHAKHGELPAFVHMLGHNHLSPALYLGLPEDQLAPQLRRFIEENL
jgi:acetyl esterase/lipase